MAFIFIIIAQKFRFYCKGRAGIFPVIGPVMAVLFSITGPMCDMLGRFSLSYSFIFARLYDLHFTVHA